MKSLGNRQFLLVVGYEDQRLLLGVTPGKIDYLCPLDSPQALNPDFSAMLAKTTNQQAWPYPAWKNYFYLRPYGFWQDLFLHFRLKPRPLPRHQSALPLLQRRPLLRPPLKLPPLAIHRVHWWICKLAMAMSAKISARPSKSWLWWRCWRWLRPWSCWWPASPGLSLY